ncbi:response regulator [Lichenihabitans sp. Uapishka_5]|uniref:response regulator n=1 Tax=Lichenihabitans sp. Uapishka_5 TaxID=3037302 RepID=UPI0029E7FEAB|nr:response regulator [Lichenihabitans sp. Uapishka_5]MDX7951773.1 response regulator [Lichenihabitans sp. Uapishka_5]
MTDAYRVLVVEDEMMVAMLVEDMLVEMGYRVVGPAYRLSDGLRLAQSETIDFAVLDVNLNGARSFPIAAVLVDRGIPFVFATGYGYSGVELEYPGVPVISKPFTLGRLNDALTKAEEVRET